MQIKSIINAGRLDAAKLSNDEIRRYSRHLILPEVTMEGQRRLKAASVLLIGAGGLGSPLSMYLAAAGVGRLGLVDFDVVDESNLHRQIVHGTKNVGRPKVQSAQERIFDVNPHVQVDLHETQLTAANAIAIARPYDLIIDGTDNFPTRYLANDVSVLLKKVNVYGSIFRFEGQASVFAPHLGGPCYRCLYPEPPPPGSVPSCAEAGVLGILPGIIGIIQATEAVKLIIGRGDSLMGRLLLFDALQMKFRELKLRRNPNCPICGDNPSIKQLIDYEQFCGLSPGETLAAQAADGKIEEISVKDLKRRLDKKENFILVDVREPSEFEICRIPGSKLIPLGELPGRLHELDKQREILVHCKSGGRSKKAVKLLHEAGFQSLKNVTGGIEAWADQVDPTVPKY
jgi:adenylyltransferase/sulfurtransferase